MEAVVDRIERHSTIVFDARESLLLGSSYQLAIAYDRGGGIMTVLPEGESKDDQESTLA